MIHDDLPIVNGDFSQLRPKPAICSSYGSGHGVTQWPWYMMVLVSSRIYEQLEVSEHIKTMRKHVKDAKDASEL